MVAALAEARGMAYVQGRWVYTENSQEVHYSLVHPSAVCLPANGEYTAYTAWGKTRCTSFFFFIKDHVQTVGCSNGVLNDVP